ncbi:GP46-like surface antigen, putative [Bodo saltans]|uniref:GP46-like surface antigen, putative n=1 Tax=Bodo saltans TaxID=75058 RepID=A0A0S4KJA7_BODSA|nr:GP46-like surface antigen, putative [Bodo saltans]|eukprot:CUI15064.1 GP46-like surface antigen, putative [Bodo saltans]
MGSYWMQYLDLSANMFSGNPPNLVQAPNLISLNISHNRFYGSLILSTSLSSLSGFDVACNSLVGSLPSWSNSYSLKFVNVSCGNLFSGSVPPFSSLSYNYLTTLDLSDQALTGTLSSILGQVLSEGSSGIGMTALLVGGNYFSGIIPNFLTWPQLERFNVSGNNLSGTIATVGSLPSNLWSIDVSNNNVVAGSIPIPYCSSGAAPQLQHYLLGGDAHSFTGSLPTTLSTTFPNLARFSLSGSFLTTMPYLWLAGSAAWKSLTTLSLRKCEFSGTFPTPLASTQITWLDFSRNQLNGTLPADLPSYAPLLVTLNFGENGFTGQLPANWSNLAHLEHLDAHSCLLNGTIPAALSATLQTLILYNNSFVSTTSLSNVSADSNHPTESLNWWSSLMNLRQLDISANKLTTLPLVTNTNFSKLSILNMSDNRITSTLPTSWGTSLSNISALNVSRNYFFGGVPEAWGEKLALLRVFDASSNNLNSSQASLLLSLRWNVQVLRLQHNNFTGVLNSILVLSPALTDVDISYNQLTGYLPLQLLSSAGSLNYLQLQGNAFEGDLPRLWGQGNLSSLKLLNLSLNSLSGPIPVSWGTFLQRGNLSTDLCNNNICGPVPKQLRSFQTVVGGWFHRCGGAPKKRHRMLLLHKRSHQHSHFLQALQDTHGSVNDTLHSAQCLH